MCACIDGGLGGGEHGDAARTGRVRVASPKGEEDASWCLEEEDR